MYKHGLILGLVLFAAFAAIPVLAQTPTGEPGNSTLQEVVNSAFSNPRAAVVMLVEFILGVALGYVGAKALKYILAFIGILVLGSILSAWSLGGSLEDLAAKLGVQLQELLPVLKQFALAVGATIVGPAAIGVIVGVIIAFARK